jgi:putative hemolysin
MALRRIRVGRVLAFAALVALAAACGKKEESASKTPAEAAPTLRPQTEVLNPASLHCKKIEGTALVVKRMNGGEYGVCRLKTGRECEEWALFLGFCPPTGIDASAISDPAERYCALRGGRLVAAGSGTAASCALPGNVTCTLKDLYAGKCEPATK